MCPPRRGSWSKALLQPLILGALGSKLTGSSRHLQGKGRCWQGSSAAGVWGKTAPFCSLGGCTGPGTVPTRPAMKTCKAPCHLALLHFVYLVSAQTRQPKSVRVPSRLSPHVRLKKDVGKVEPVCLCWGINHGSVVPRGSAWSKAGGSGGEQSQHPSVLPPCFCHPQKVGTGRGQ